LNKYIDKAENCSTIWNNKDGFEVEEKDKRYKVDIEAMTCPCRYGQLASIPCAHAITALFVSSKPLKDCIADCYSVVVYNNIYDHSTMPMGGMEQWPPTDHAKSQPPGYVKMLVRQRKESRREQGEVKKGIKMSKVGSKSKCSSCRCWDLTAEDISQGLCHASPTVGLNVTTLGHVLLYVLEASRGGLWRDQKRNVSL
jgi:hypothetical protein